MSCFSLVFFFFFQAEDGIRDKLVTGVQTCALPIYRPGGVVRHLDPRPGGDVATRDGPVSDGAELETRVERIARAPGLDRSEERRVGKECRSRWSPYH